MNPGGFYASLLLFLLSWTQIVLGVSHHHSDTKAPPAGVSGTHHDKEHKIIHVHYGSNDLQEHMLHLLENVKKYPHNKEPFKVHQKSNEDNRKKAMKKADMKNRPGTARDEKPPNFVHHDGKSVTVKRVPKAESGKHFLE